MKVAITQKAYKEVKYLKASAGVRYWEDATVNGVEDAEGDLIPCRNGDRWEPLIDLETGIIQNWNQGVKADIHYKVCDDIEYFLQDEKKDNIIQAKGYYVPNMMCPEGEGFGDYVIMKVDENGQIDKWKVDMDKFTEED